MSDGRHHRPGRRRQPGRRRIRAGRARRGGAARGRATLAAGAGAGSPKWRSGRSGSAGSPTRLRRSRRRRNAWSRIEAAISAPAAAAHALRRCGRASTFWRAFAIGSAALAAASIAALAYIGIVPAARAPLMATLGGTGGQPTLRRRRHGVRQQSGGGAGRAPDQRSARDRAVADPGGRDRPRSLGLIQAGQPIRLDVPPDSRRRLTPDAALAVSLEPPGGSPTGQPTGPVVALGKLTSL